MQSVATAFVGQQQSAVSAAVVFGKIDDLNIGHSKQESDVEIRGAKKPRLGMTSFF